MGIAEIEVMKGFVRLCDDGFRMGWHERNGGNLTYRMKPHEVAECRPFFYEKIGAWTSCGIVAESLAGEYFIATGSGKFMRNMAINTEDNICIAEINEKGDAYRIVWGLTRGGVPTSEFPSHLLNHSVKKAATNGSHRIIYHAHTPSVIALTFVLPLTDRDFSRVLWKSMTECPIVFPAGVGLVPWMIPGGADIAIASSKLMEEYDAIIWAHHGTFCSGPDFDATFGLMHTLEKSAEIYLKALSCGTRIRQTITDDALRQVAKAFGVTLNEKFLD
ncbi:MAG: rhamnulose-1-phosphate aldolase [Treponema sp.]|jgi:rhamnulose-1-phosphate aldolase|nr:rhamnulose-1-phosphate aldolase [Treponema sp.]